MRPIRTILFILFSSLILCPVRAQVWRSHPAYNNITLIAMSPDAVYALSDGSLFSVDKQTEKIHIYDRQSGLHGTDITCISYDEKGGQLVIGYESGKIDVLTSSGTRYISALYDKDMTQRKTIHNITIAGRTAYLATAYGVQTMDLNQHKLVNSYWLRPGGEETEVLDVIVTQDSIYAFTSDSLFCASLEDNIVDYTRWNREERSSRIQPDPDKGKHYQDDTDHWYAGGAEGIVRQGITERISYKPQGPLSNIPYRISACGKKIAVIQGGYNITSYKRPGMVMTYNGQSWQNYDADYMTAHLGVAGSRDYSDIIFAPDDSSHFYVSSFGYGLIEFRNNEFYQHYNPSNSGLEPVLTGASYPYIWVDGLTWDADGNLWMLNNCINGVKVLMKDQTWVALNNAACADLGRTQQLLISTRNPNIKFVSSIRDGLGVFDDNGTISDQSDDRAVLVTEFADAAGGSLVLPRLSFVYQTASGVLLLGTEVGLYRIDEPEQILTGYRTCVPVELSLPEEEISDVFGAENIRCIAKDNESHLWIGTQSSGLYCLSEDLTSIVQHYSTHNAPLQSNDILSLCDIPETSTLFIGTGAGLVELKYDDSGEGEGIRWEKDNTISEGTMKNWKTHFSYNNISWIEDAGDKAYCISEGALLGVNKSSEEVIALSKLTGLSGSNAMLAAYNKQTRKTLVVYQNGQIDVIYPDGEVKNMPDVFLTTETHPADFYSAYSDKDRIYICSSLGVINVNMTKNEIADTYVLMDADQQELTVHYVSIMDNVIYAASDAQIYSATLGSNLVDYAMWTPLSTPFGGTINGMGSRDGYLYVLSGQVLYRYHDQQWKTLLTAYQWENLFIHPQSVLVRSDKGLVFEITGDESEQLDIPYAMTDMIRNGTDYWLAVAEKGLVKWNSTNGTQEFAINSPCVNYSYRVRTSNDKLIMVPGGYFASRYNYKGHVMALENGWWRNYTQDQLYAASSIPFHDYCDAAIDPADPSHFYVASFGYGLTEFRNNEYYRFFSPSNSALEPVQEGAGFPHVWVDGLAWDPDGNLWMLNNSYSGVKVLLKSGQWARIGNKATRDLSRTKDLIVWNQDPTIKVLTCARVTPGIGVFNDNGTITNQSDDRAVFVSTFYDQNEKAVSPQFIYSICQMANGEIWVGTESGIIIIPDVRNLLNHDYHCRRVIIPRNDGTGLGDYLLADERINAIAEDAAGRKWIGTETSGLYLVSDDGLETFEHFTKYNSPLVSDAVYTIAILPKTGEVFIGTSIGLLSYQSDANEAKENMSGAYAYPNPVAPNYQGYISITGLMDNTEVRIVDAGGNLVCKTRSNGGLAVWDGKDASGKRACPGIYTAFCNASGGKTVVKIMLIR